MVGILGLCVIWDDAILDRKRFHPQTHSITETWCGKIRTFKVHIATYACIMQGFLARQYQSTSMPPLFDV